MKKIIIVGGVLILMFFIASCTIKEDVSTNPTLFNYEEPSTNDNNSMSYVDDKIAVFIKSESFQKGNLNDRIQGMKEVLDSLVKEHYLKDYKIYNQSDRPRVEYTYSGGEIGCTLLTEFKKNQN
jgi:hypothetical protein